MKIAICDDLQEERLRLIPQLYEFLAANGISAELCEYDSGEALTAAFSKGLFSLIFLDIYMGGISGVETANRLKAADPDCTIIFTTTSREHGAEAFDVEAFHYLIKPIEREKLFSVLGKWYDLLCEAKTVMLKCGRISREVYIRDILYIEVLGRNCTVHTSSEIIETQTPLSVIEAMLPKAEFCKPIRYCLAALGHIKAVDDDKLIMQGGETLPLSRRERDAMREQLAAYRLRKLRRR